MQHLQKTRGVPRSPSASPRMKSPTTSEEAPLLHLSGTLTQPSDTPKACQWPGYTTFSLDKDLESLPHPFRVDQRLKLQARFRAVRLGLSLIVEVRKFISLPERQQKSRL